MRFLRAFIRTYSFMRILGARYIMRIKLFVAFKREHLGKVSHLDKLNILRKMLIPINIISTDFTRSCRGILYKRSNYLRSPITLAALLTIIEQIIKNFLLCAIIFL